MAKTKNKGGRPPGTGKYKEEFDKQAYKLCLLGADDKRLADFFGVTETEIKLNLPPDINDLFVEINGVQTTCNQKIVLGATEIICPIDFKSDYYLNAKYNTNYVLIDLDGQYLFKQKLISDFSVIYKPLPNS